MSEADLVGYYDEHPFYWSPLSDNQIGPMLESVGRFPEPPLLDLGCGDGRLAGQVDFPITGVDYSQIRINIAERRYPTSEWICHDINTWEDHREWQTIILVDVLEHLEQPHRLVARARRRLAEGGFVFATIPIDFPDEAHLRVWSVEDVVDELNPTQVGVAHTVEGDWVLCLWER